VDPFCGRGTTNLAARLYGHRTIGVDSSPVAVATTAAKLPRGVVQPYRIVQLARRLIREHSSVRVPEGEFWELAYDRDVLGKLCALRAGLLAFEGASDSAKGLRALILGALHGPKRVDGGSSYFSNQSPRTFAPKPRYAISFWRRHGEHPPKVRVLDLIQARAERAYCGSFPIVPARVLHGDSRTIDWARLVKDLGPIQWVITSPPYYGLRTYRPDQWLREWFLGGACKVD
jgi:hypothetical protein